MKIPDKPKVGLCVIIPDSASKEDRDAISDVLRTLNGMYDIRDYDEVSSPDELPDNVKGYIKSGRALPFTRANIEWRRKVGERAVRKWKKRH